LMGRLAGLRFPLAAYALWRVVQGVAVAIFDGDPIKSVLAWDGEWYQWILRHGYAFRPDRGAEQPTAFFPVLPWVTKAVQFVIRSELAAVVIVSTLAGAAAVCALYVAGRAWRGERVARAGVVAMLAYPASLFLWAFYTEALFVAVTAVAFVAAAQGRRWVAVVAGGLAVATRLPGIVVVPVLLLIDWRRRGRVSAASSVYLLAAIGLVPVIVAQQVQAGDGLAFLTAGQAWGREPSWPWVPLVDLGRIAADPAYGDYRPVAAGDLAASVLFLAAAVVAFVRRFPVEAGAWIVLMIGVPLFTTLPVSFMRYALAAWPAFLVAADVGVRTPVPVRAAAVAALAVLSVLLLSRFAGGDFIG
jgi:hypothetical protein